MRLLALLGDYYHCSDQQLHILKRVQEQVGFEVELLRYPERVESLDLRFVDLFQIRPGYRRLG